MAGFRKLACRFLFLIFLFDLIFVRRDASQTTRAEACATSSVERALPVSMLALRLADKARWSDVMRHVTPTIEAYSTRHR
jgi:hypothetical protein